MRSHLSRLTSRGLQRFGQAPVFRPFSTTEQYVPKSPDKLNAEMAEGISDATQFYVKHGISNQRLIALREENVPVVLRWQKMMEIFLATQVHVIAGLGYTPDEKGLTKYANDLAQCLQTIDPTLQELFAEARRDTWRNLVATAFGLKPEDIPRLEIVQAREVMHEISSKMMSPDTLLEIQTRTSGINESDVEKELVAKHQILQDIIVNSVYLSGNPSICESRGFGTGPEAYAKLQCSMSDHEGDPLISQYAAAAMQKMWEAAGIGPDAAAQATAASMN